MKKTYIQPKMILMGCNPTSICAGSPIDSWHAGNNLDDHTHDEDEEPDDNWGQIITDKGEGKNGSYDPWNSDNW